MTVVRETLSERDSIVAPSRRLARGVLSTFDIATSTLANIAPAMSFFFSFGAIAAAAGLAAPLTVIAAAIAIALLGNTLSQFVRIHPSTGSFVTFIGKGLGGYPAIVSAVVLCAGYIICAAGVVAITGGWTEIVVKHYVGISIPWQLLTLLLTSGVVALIVGGAKPSTKAAAGFFGFELLLLVVVAVAVLIRHAGHLTLQPLSPAKLTGGITGLSLAFPLAVFMFIGWENSASMAEESEQPRRAVPRAIYASILLITIVYLLLSYATVIGFNGNVTNLTKSSVPFIDAARSVAGLLMFFAYIAGFSSIMSSLLAATNSQARILFSAGREGLMPAFTAQVTTKTRTPWAAFMTFISLALGIVYIFGWHDDPQTTIVFFGEAATLGTILIALVYLFTNLALPAYMLRFAREQFSLVSHLVLPLLGAVAIGYPLYELVKSGQTAPYSTYPLVAGGVLVAALIDGAIVYWRDSTVGQRVGSIVADVDDTSGEVG